MASQSWRMKLASGRLGGNSVAWVSADPMGATEVWLVDTRGGLWVLDDTDELHEDDSSSPTNLRIVAVTEGRDLLAIDANLRLWSRVAGAWTQRSGPKGLANPVVQVTGDGSGRGWLTTRDGEVFTTSDGGAHFLRDSPEFDVGGPAQAKKACFSVDSATRWFLDSINRVSTKGRFDSTPRILNVGSGTPVDISVDPAGLLWIVQSQGNFTEVLTTKGDDIGDKTDGGEKMFVVAPDGRSNIAWGAKSDGSLWVFE